MKNCNKIIMVWCMLIISSITYAQQIPLFNQYFAQPSLAYASASVFAERPQLSLLYRGQWSGLEGAPQTIALNYTNPLNNKLGYHVNVNSFQLGILKQTYFAGGFSKVFKFNAHSLSIGAELGMSLFSLDDARVSIESLNDELIQNLLGNNGSAVNLNLSLSYQHKSFTAHVAVPGLINQSIANDAFVELNSANQSDYMVGLSHLFVVDPTRQIYFTPNVTWRYQEVLGSSFDVSGMLEFKDRFQVTAGYRQDYGFTGGLGVKIKSNLLFTYSYDFGKADVPFLSDGLNEIGLHFMFANRQEKAIALQSRGQVIINRISQEEIYDRKLVSPDDQKIVIEYFSAQEKGSKKKRIIKGEAAFVQLLNSIKDKGLVRIQAEATQRKMVQQELDAQREREAKEQMRLEQEVREKLAIEAEETHLREEEKIRSVADVQRVKTQSLKEAEFLLVVGSYQIGGELAQKNSLELKKEYKDADVFTSKKRALDYVYILSFVDFEEAIQTMNKFKVAGKFTDSWIHIIRLSRE